MATLAKISWLKHSHRGNLPFLYHKLFKCRHVYRTTTATNTHSTPGIYTCCSLQQLQAEGTGWQDVRTYSTQYTAAGRRYEHGQTLWCPYETVAHSFKCQWVETKDLITLRLHVSGYCDRVKGFPPITSPAFYVSSDNPKDHLLTGTPRSEPRVLV